MCVFIVMRVLVNLRQQSVPLLLTNPLEYRIQQNRSQHGMRLSKHEIPTAEVFYPQQTHELFCLVRRQNEDNNCSTFILPSIITYVFRISLECKVCLLCHSLMPLKQKEKGKQFPNVWLSPLIIF